MTPVDAVRNVAGTVWLASTRTAAAWRVLTGRPAWLCGLCGAAAVSEDVPVCRAHRVLLRGALATTRRTR